MSRDQNKVEMSLQWELGGTFTAVLLKLVPPAVHEQQFPSASASIHGGWGLWEL